MPSKNPMGSNILRDVSAWLADKLSQRGSYRVAVPDWGWFNAVWHGGVFQRAHLQRLVTDKVDIVHCTVFPHQDDPAPVFGYDAIHMSGKNTALFTDMTPVTDAPYKWWPVPEIEGPRRELPDWAEFFSDDVIAAVPTDADVWIGAEVLKPYLRKLGAQASEARDKIVAGQQQYIENQRQNPKTRKMLASILGSDDKAREYINTVMWPDVKEPDHE